MDRELLILLAFVYLAASQSCPEYAMPFGGKCYEYYITGADMLSAQETCWFSEYKLVEIMSAEENNFVQNTIEYMPGVWMGIRRQEFWRTILTNQELQYVNWVPWDDFSNLTANCALIADDGIWKSVDCEINDQVHTMCESEPGQFCLDGGINFQGKCYIQSSETMTMESGDEFCRNIGYNLLEINSNEEDTFLQYMILDSGGTAVWMGIKRQMVWTTISTNEELTYTNWAPSFPVNEYEARCAIITSEGDWRNVDCQDQATIMCQSRGGRDCPEYDMTFKGKHYLIGTFVVSMKMWEELCSYVGYELVVINDAEENDYIRDLIVRSNLTGAWIGVNWSDTLTVQPNMEDATYTRWADGYPSGDTMCVSMDSTGYWKNIPCDNDLQAVAMCGKTQTSPGCPGNVDVFKGKSYLFGAHTFNFTNAMEACLLLGFMFVVIDDIEENKFIQDYLTRKKLNGGWLGLFYHFYLDQLETVTINNILANYTRWETGYPRGNDACVYIDTTGFWKNIPCDNNNQAVVMCEKTHE